MSRVTKDPQVRMNEFIDTAEELFNARGYFETQISDIVKAIGVAQGTFYYYFKSKEAIVEAIIQRKVDQILVEIDNIVTAENLDATQKLNLAVEAVLTGTCNHLGVVLQYLYNEQSLHIMDKLWRKGSEQFSAPLIKIISEGNEQGCFNVNYLEETVEFILGTFRVLVESQHTKAVAVGHEHRLEIAQKIITTALGAKEGSLSFKK